MGQGSLVIPQMDVGARFLGEFQKYAPVKAAFWLKESDDGDWSLYVASDAITDDNFDLAYGEVIRLVGVLRDPLFDPFQVKVIGTTDPLAKAALEIQNRYQGQVALRFHGEVLGGLPVEELWLYPSPIPVMKT